MCIRDSLNASRKKRIAAGSGTTVQEINTLTKQLKQMQTMMKRMRKMGKGQMMGMMKQMMGGNMDELEMLTETLDAESLAADMAQFDTGNTASGTMLPGLGGKPGALPGLGGSSAQDGKKKQDTKK